MISPAMSRAAAAAVNLAGLAPAARVAVMQAADQADGDDDFARRVAGLIDLPARP